MKDINFILNHQQNRHTVLYIDRILEMECMSRTKTLKCFTYNEWFFPAHFENDPNVPGFILMESLVQSFIMTFLSNPQYKGQKTNFVAANNVKFTKKVVPGDNLITEAYLDTFKRGIAKGRAIGKVENDVACKADFLISLPNELDKYKPRNDT